MKTPRSKHSDRGESSGSSPYNLRMKQTKEGFASTSIPREVTDIVAWENRLRRVIPSRSWETFSDSVRYSPSNPIRFPVEDGKTGWEKEVGEAVGELVYKHNLDIEAFTAVQHIICPNRMTAKVFLQGTPKQRLNLIRRKAQNMPPPF